MDDMYILFIILGITFAVFLVVLIFAWCRKTNDTLSIEEELHEIKTLELTKTKTANGNTAKPVHRSLDETGRVPSTVSRSLEDTGRVPSTVSRSLEDTGRVPSTVSRSLEDTGRVPSTVSRSLGDTGRVPSTVSRSLEDTGRVPSIVVEFIDVQKEPAVEEKNSDVTDKADVNDENAVNDVNVDNDGSSTKLKSSETDDNNERPVRISIGETCINKGLEAPSTLAGRTSDA